MQCSLGPPTYLRSSPKDFHIKAKAFEIIGGNPSAGFRAMLAKGHVMSTNMKATSPKKMAVEYRKLQDFVQGEAQKEGKADSNEFKMEEYPWP